jgi:hypothetical protein
MLCEEEKGDSGRGMLQAQGCVYRLAKLSLSFEKHFRGLVICWTEDKHPRCGRHYGGAYSPGDWGGQGGQ